MRAELLKNLSRLAPASEVIHYYSNIGERIERPLEPPRRNAFNSVTCSRHTLHLHLACCAHKEYLCIWPGLLYGIGNGDCREDMSSRAASAYNYSWCLIHILSIGFSLNTIYCPAYGENYAKHPAYHNNGCSSRTYKRQSVARYRKDAYIYKNMQHSLACNYKAI